VHNLVTVPLIGVAATALALVGMAVPGTGFLLTTAGYITGCNIQLLRWLDFGYLYPLVRPGLSEVLLYYAIMTAVLFVGHKPVAALLVVVLLPLAAVQGIVDYRQRINTDLKVHLIDVGMGDAALVEAPGGLRILIDGGGLARSDFDIGRQVVGPFLLYRKIRTLDYVVSTHPHIDHIGGLGYILANFKVRRLVTSGYFPEEPAFLHLLHEARSRGIEHVLWNEGDRFASHDLTIDVLHPPRSRTWQDPNDASLVLHIRHGKVTFLLPGDVHGDVEERLVANGYDLRSNVLKATHHGSALSNTPALIYAVRPDIAIVSSGAGITHLPGAAALQRYQDRSIPVLRTDTDGCIEVHSDGNRFTIKTRPR
jgi:competence protein ComEC